MKKTAIYLLLIMILLSACSCQKESMDAADTEAQRQEEISSKNHATIEDFRIEYDETGAATANALIDGEWISSQKFSFDESRVINNRIISDTKVTEYWYQQGTEMISQGMILIVNGKAYITVNHNRVCDTVVYDIENDTYEMFPVKERTVAWNEYTDIAEKNDGAYCISSVLGPVSPDKRYIVYTCSSDIEMENYEYRLYDTDTNESELIYRGAYAKEWVGVYTLMSHMCNEFTWLDSDTLAVHLWYPIADNKNTVSKNFIFINIDDEWDYYPISEDEYYKVSEMMSLINGRA